MITTKRLKEIGYTELEVKRIMCRFVFIGLIPKSIKISNSYMRNGHKCNITYFGDAFPLEEVVESMQHYLENRKYKKIGKEFWDGVLESLINIKNKT